MRYRHVLVPIDFSEHSLSAFQAALDHFADTGSTLTLLHVVEPGTKELIGSTVNVDHTAELRKRLQTLGNSHRDRWADVSSLTEVGKPTTVIIQTARREKADVVVMGSHGSGSLAQALFGSTTYDVARKLDCAVLICKR